MKKIDYAKTVGLLANIGVLIGIVLLVFELNQNRDMMRAQIRNELARGLPDILGIPIANQGLTDALVRANKGEPLTPSDTWQVAAWVELSFRYWENVHYQYRQGLYDESEFSRHRDTIKSVIAVNPKMSTFWCNNRLLYSEPFMRFMDDLLDGPEC